MYLFLDPKAEISLKGHFDQWPSTIGTMPSALALSGAARVIGGTSGGTGTF